MNERALRPGDLVQSIAGHDSGEVYVVIGTAQERLLLADGVGHTLERPKRKNRRHLQDFPVVEPDADTAGLLDSIHSRLQAGERVHDHELHTLIKACKRRRAKVDA